MLETMNTAKLQSAISSFLKNKKVNAAYFNEKQTERKEREAYYKSFTKDKLLKMSEEDFHEYISRLWSMVMWGRKDYVIKCLLDDNGLDHIKTQLADLLFGEQPIEKRWDHLMMVSIKTSTRFTGTPVAVSSLYLTSFMMLDETAARFTP